MQKLRNIMASAGVSTAVLFAVTAPAYAVHSNGVGEGASKVATTATTTTTDTSTTDTTASQTGEPQAGQDKQTAKADHQSKVAANKTVEKQKVCENRKHGLQTKFNHIVTNSQRIKTHIDSILKKAETYQSTNNVQTTDFASLDTAATNAGTAADKAIANLKTAAATDIDCNSGNASSQVLAFKTQAAATRDALKAYRQAVLAVLHNLEQAKATTNTSGGSKND